MSPHIDVSEMDMLSLHLWGAVAVEALTQEQTAQLCREANALSFTPRDGVTKTGVTQNFSAVETFPKDSSFTHLAHKTGLSVGAALDRHGNVWGSPLSFNDYSLQKYPVSKPGQQYAISPHMDHKNCMFVVAIYLLYGKAPFCVCKDRSGAGSHEIKAKPGDLILLRAEGFSSMSRRPLHFVGPVTEERLTFGLRHVIRDPLPRHRA